MVAGAADDAGGTGLLPPAEPVGDATAAEYEMGATRVDDVGGCCDVMTEMGGIRCCACGCCC